MLTKPVMLFSNKTLTQRELVNPLEKINGTNASALTPCLAVLMEKVKLANLVATVWKNARLPDPYQLDPKQCGWVEVNGTYQIRWYKCDTVPKNVWQALDVDVAAVNDEEDSYFADPSFAELVLVQMNRIPMNITGLCGVSLKHICMKILSFISNIEEDYLKLNFVCKLSHSEKSFFKMIPASRYKTSSSMFNNIFR